MHPLALAFAVAIAAMAAHPGAAHAQRVPDGYFKVENAEFGFRFHCPRTFKEIPTQPGDTVLVGRFVRMEPVSTKRSDRAKRPTSGSDTEIWIVSIDRPAPPEEAAPPETAPGGNEPPPPGEPPVGEPPVGPPPSTDPPEGEEGSAGEAKPEAPEKTGPRSYEEAHAERLAASTFEEFVKKRLSGWTITSTEAQESRDERWTEYRLELARKGRDGTPAVIAAGAAWLYEREDRVLGLVGLTSADDLRARWKNFLTGARSLESFEAELDLADLERHYAMHPEYKDPAFRIERCKGLARGWKSIDTENYLILHHTRDKALLDKIENDLEALRAFYEQLFPPDRPVEAVSVVRVCRDRKEYLDYGGAPQSAGYWNFVVGELVLYDNVAGRQGSRFGNRDSTIVLYHEAFHQYIHYSAGEVAPHTWFNEGYADYFSGTVVYARSDKVKEIEPNPWRRPVIRKAVEEGKTVPFEKFLKAEKAEYYRRDVASLYYAQGWSLIYFLNESKAARAHPEWQRITPVYFETLKQACAEERAKLGPDAVLEQKAAADKAARERALEAALQGVDTAELEAEWKKYVARYLR